MLNCICLCNKVAFNVDEVPGMVFNCHCSLCRRAHGAAFATQILCNRSSLTFLRGQEHLKEYVADNTVRAFCDYCGARLMNYSRDGSDYLSVSISAVVNRTDFKPIGECFVLNKLPFVRLDPTIPHHKALPKI